MSHPPHGPSTGTNYARMRSVLWIRENPEMKRNIANIIGWVIRSLQWLRTSTLIAGVRSLFLHSIHHPPIRVEKITVPEEKKTGASCSVHLQLLLSLSFFFSFRIVNRQ